MIPSICKDSESVCMFRCLCRSRGCLACHTGKDPKAQSSFRGEEGDHLVMPNTGSAGDPFVPPDLREQLQVLNSIAGPWWLHPSPPQTFLKDTPSPLAGLSPAHCSPFHLIPTSTPFIECPLQIPATYHLLRDTESQPTLPTLTAAFLEKPRPSPWLPHPLA